MTTPFRFTSTLLCPTTLALALIVGSGAVAAPLHAQRVSGAAIEGKVVDYFSNEPIPGVEVIATTETRIKEELPLARLTARTDSQGRFLLQGGLPLRRYALTVRKQGYAEQKGYAGTANVGQTVLIDDIKTLKLPEAPGFYAVMPDGRYLHISDFWFKRLREHGTHNLNVWNDSIDSELAYIETSSVGALPTLAATPRPVFVNYTAKESAPTNFPRFVIVHCNQFGSRTTYVHVAPRRAELTTFVIPEAIYIGALELQKTQVDITNTHMARNPKLVFGLTAPRHSAFLNVRLNQVFRAKGVWVLVPIKDVEPGTFAVLPGSGFPTSWESGKLFKIGGGDTPIQKTRKEEPAVPAIPTSREEVPTQPSAPSPSVPSPATPAPAVQTFEVAHVHSGMVKVERYCFGPLQISDRLQFAASNANDRQTHNFEVACSDITEVKKNRFVGSANNAFHVKAGKKNYNLVAKNSAPPDPIIEAIQACVTTAQTAEAAPEASTAAPTPAAPAPAPTAFYPPAGTLDKNEQYFGWRSENNAFAPNTIHLGEDFDRPYAHPVYAIADGEVVRARMDVGSYGGEGILGGGMIVRHKTDTGQTLYALYAHVENMKGLGPVKAGEQIATVGHYIWTNPDTGEKEDIPHLHFAVFFGENLPEGNKWPWRQYISNISDNPGWEKPMVVLKYMKPGPYETK
jgi:murein DD-endopeptidase MepM/ murein hydrolase activator NlpD